MKRIMNEDTIASISGNEFFDGNLEATDKLCQHVILNGPKYYIGGQPVCWVNQYPDVTRIPRDYTRRPHSGIVPLRQQDVFSIIYFTMNSLGTMVGAFVHNSFSLSLSILFCILV